VSCLLSSNDGSLWMSTNHGISRMDVSNATFQNFSLSDGLPGLDLTGWNACAKGRNDRLYFGGFSGAAMRRSQDDIAPNKNAPPVVFTQIHAGNSTVLPTANHSAEKVQTITLPFSANQMTVSFSALNFRQPENTLYRYMLEGYDTTWHLASRDQRSVSFATLPTGTFKLLVQATTSPQTWTAPMARLDVTVLPPWWRTWWFYALVLCAFVACIVGAFKYRINQVRADYRIRLDERMAERGRVARELHDTLLQSFQGLLFRLYAARSLMNDQPEEAARMVDLILQKSDDAIIEGRQAISMLRDPETATKDMIDVVRAIGEEISANSRERRIKFETQISGTPYELDHKVRDEVCRIIVEALRNAFNHSKATRVTCLFDYGSSALRIRVGDNGVGFQTTEDERSQRWGIKGMKERANRIGSHLIIESLSGSGTTIELAVPVRRTFGALRFARARHR
jgi:signal transduction histidine kinase